jgi:hypothetical protein
MTMLYSYSSKQSENETRPPQQLTGNTETRKKKAERERERGGE